MNADEKVNILMVDDTPANLLALEAVLADLNQNLVKASSGREALKYLLRLDFAVVLLDVNMPDIDGFETAALIRQRPRSEHTPIIFVTAHDATETGKFRGYSLGAVDYIYAPVIPEILKAKVASFVELSKIQLLHQRAEARARQEAARAQTLARVATRLNAQLELYPVLQAVCEATAQALEVPAVFVALYDPKNQVFSLACDVGLPPNFQQQMPVVPRFIYEGGDEHPERVNVLSDVQALSPTLETDLFATFHIRTSVSALMLRNDQPTGCLTIFTTHQTRHFAGEELEFLRGLADQAALAVTNAQLFSELRSSRERLRQLAQQLVLVQEEERRNLSRELHDQVGQVLVALRINLGLMQNDLPPEFSSFRQGLADALELTATLTNDVRTIAHTIRPPIFSEKDLNNLFEGLCRDFARYTHLSIHYIGTEVPPLPDPVPISFYRFLQEALTNAAKHAHAKQVEVIFERQDGTVRLSVKDDGIGFDPQDTKRLAGIGLTGVQERFEMLGGWLEIDSQPNQGTHLTAYIPLKEEL